MKTYKCPYCLYKFERPKEDILKKPACINPATKNGRPVCQKELPLNFWESQPLVIAIIGGSNVGKTYFCNALLHQLYTNDIFGELGIRGKIEGDDETREKIFKRFQDFWDGIALLLTTRGEESDVFLIELVITKGKSAKTVYISIFDTPGDGMREEDYMLKNFTHLREADGFIFLIEPLQIKHFKDRILQKFPYLTKNFVYDLYEILPAFFTFLNFNNKPNKPVKSWEDFLFINSRNNRIDKPFSFVIAKYDQLSEFIHEKLPDNIDLESWSFNEQKFNLEYAEQFSKELYLSITDNHANGKNIINLIEPNLETFTFFGAKSIDVDEFGKPRPMKYFDNEGNAVLSKPQGVIVPLLWILTKLNLFIP